MLHSFFKKAICLSIICSASLQAQVLRPSPDATLSLHMGDIPHSAEKWNASAFGALWDSKEMASFRKPMGDWMKKELQKLQKELHLKDEPKWSDLFRGELLFSLESIDLSGEELKKASLHAYLAFECSEDSQLMDALKKQLLEKSKNKRRDVTFMGYKFHTQALPKKKSEKGLAMDKTLELRFGTMKNMAYIGIAKKKDHENTLRRIISLMKKSKEKKQESPEMTMKINMEDINALIVKGLSEAEKKQKKTAPTPGPAMMLQGLDFEKVVRSLGLLDFKSISMATVEHSKFEKFSTKVLMKQSPRGIISMFVPTASIHLGSIPEWVPNDIITYQATAIPVSSWYDTIMSFMQQELPMMAPMVQMQLGSLKQSMGLDLKRDLFDLFGDQLYQVGFEQDKNTPLEQVGQTVAVFSLKNGTKVEQNLLKIFGMAPMLKLEPVSYMEGTYYSVGPKLNGLQNTIGFHKNYFLFAQNTEDIKKVIRLISRPSPKGLAKSKAFLEYRKLLPARYQQLSFQSLDRTFLSLIQILKANQGMISQGMKKWPFQLDFSKLPGKEAFDDQFGHVLNVSVSKGDVLYSENYSKKVIVNE